MRSVRAAYCPELQARQSSKQWNVVFLATHHVSRRPVTSIASVDLEALMAGKDGSAFLASEAPPVSKSLTPDSEGVLCRWGSGLMKWSMPWKLQHQLW